MPVIDTHNLATNDQVSERLGCDVCVVGTGPAGSAIARELSGGGLRITILESGAFERREFADRLNDIENVGWPRVMDQWSVRNRIVGGSSYTWTGRCAAFDEIDFETRDWLPFSGWPFDLRTLTPFLDRSAAYLGLDVGSDFSDDRFWKIVGHAKPKTNLNPKTLLPFFWQYSKDSANPYDYMRFGRHLASAIGHNVTFVTNATVLRINTDVSGRSVKSVDFAGPDGRHWTLLSKVVVLATGAIENARLLLASDTIQPRGLGNEHDQVGRYLMDHPRGTIARFELKDADRLLERFGLYKGSGKVTNRFQAGVRVSPEAQRAERLLNCSAWIHEEIAADDPWHALKRFLRGRANVAADTRLLLANAGLLTRGFHSYLIARNGLPRKISAVSLDGMCEQIPDPDSRVTLSEKRDPLGQRLPRINWRIHPEEPRAMRRIAEFVIEQFPKMGLPAPVLEPWARDGTLFPSHFHDIAHPTGTTRISEDPRQGVVDPNLQVHGVHGAYVAGSSVFPTAGHCNPTQMIVATALRLADELKRRGVKSQAETSAPAQKHTTRADLVLVTGASGRIGRFVTERLIARGLRVRAVTSKPLTGQQAREEAIEWRRHDFLESLDFDSLVADCSAVVHLAAELGNPDKMVRLNVDATRVLAGAAERGGTKAFVYTSSAAVYGSLGDSPITENSPVLTSSSDVKGEYWAAPWLRAYGRTKLAGEEALRAVARSVNYAIVRPTVVVDVSDLVELRNWSRARKSLFANRHAHHIFMPDVADAIVWLLERALTMSTPRPSVETYILAEDEAAIKTYKDFFDRALEASSDPTFRVLNVPWQIDWVRAFLQARTLPIRPTFGGMRFSAQRIMAVGWKAPYGMDTAVERALQQLRTGQ